MLMLFSPGRNMLRAIALASLGLLSLSACSGLRIPAPDVPVKQLPAPPVPDSTIVLPVTISLDSFLGDLGASAALEKRIRRFVERQATRNENAVLQNAYVRRQLGKAWDALQNPIALQNDLFLLLNPQALSVSPLREEGDNLQFSIGINARPKLVAASDSFLASRPLPDVAAVPAPHDPGFHIVLETELPFDLLSKELTKQFESRSFTRHGESVAVRKVTVYGSGESLVLAIAVKGSVNGTVYLSGIPAYDPAGQRLYLRNLDYTIETVQILKKAADWLIHTKLQESLAQKATWQLGERIDSARQRLTAALNLPLSDRVRMTGKIDDIKPVSVGITKNSIQAVVEAEGRAEIAISN